MNRMDTSPFFVHNSITRRIKARILNFICKKIPERLDIDEF